jgi:hypothetical protein
LLEPKIYKTNGLEAYRLLGADGSEFFYEGRVKYSEDQVFKDSQGRAYYHVTTNLGRGMDYYVEVEPEGTPIPMMKKDRAPEKDISGLVIASPRDSSEALPKETFSRPIQAKPVEKEAGSPPAFPAEKPSASFGGSVEPETPNEEDKAIVPPSDEEHKHAVEAMGSIKPKKRSFLKLTLAVIAIVIVLVAIAGGIYLYKPDWVRSHVPFLATPTPVPTIAPTITATPEPTATSTPEPTAPLGPSLYNNLYAVGAAIHATNESVVQFSNNHTKTSVGTENNLTYTLDVFDYVNAHWTNATGNATPQNATYLVSVLTGSDRDYSIAMCAIAESLGVKSRTVEAFDGYNATYYPEILVASNNSDFTTIQQYIGSRYGVKDAFAHVDGKEYWLSLARSNVPGQKVNATAEYAVDSSQAITRIS